MSKTAVIQNLENESLKKDLPDFRVGDTVRVHVRIVEGDKERVQMFQGTVISRKGSGLSETFAVHRIAYGEGMERIFLLHSPRIAKIEVLRQGRVRRSKLYYLRGTKGKAAKVRAQVYGGRKAVTNWEEQREETPVEAPNEPIAESVAEAAPAPAPVPAEPAPEPEAKAEAPAKEETPEKTEE